MFLLFLLFSKDLFFTQTTYFTIKKKTNKGKRYHIFIRLKLDKSEFYDTHYNYNETLERKTEREAQQQKLKRERKRLEELEQGGFKGLQERLEDVNHRFSKDSGYSESTQPPVVLRSKTLSKTHHHRRSKSVGDLLDRNPGTDTPTYGQPVGAEAPARFTGETEETREKTNHYGVFTGSLSRRTSRRMKHSTKSKADDDLSRPGSKKSSLADTAKPTNSYDFLSPKDVIEKKRGRAVSLGRFSRKKGDEPDLPPEDTGEKKRGRSMSLSRFSRKKDSKKDKEHGPELELEEVVEPLQVHVKDDLRVFIETFQDRFIIEISKLKFNGKLKGNIERSRKLKDVYNLGLIKALFEAKQGVLQEKKAEGEEKGSKVENKIEAFIFIEDWRRFLTLSLNPRLSKYFMLNRKYFTPNKKLFFIHKIEDKINILKKDDGSCKLQIQDDGGVQIAVSLEFEGKIENGIVSIACKLNIFSSKNILKQRGEKMAKSEEVERKKRESGDSEKVNEEKKEGEDSGIAEKSEEVERKKRESEDSGIAEKSEEVERKKRESGDSEKVNEEKKEGEDSGIAEKSEEVERKKRESEDSGIVEKSGELDGEKKRESEKKEKIKREKEDDEDEEAEEEEEIDEIDTSEDGEKLEWVFSEHEEDKENFMRATLFIQHYKPRNF